MKGQAAGTRPEASRDMDVAVRRPGSRRALQKRGFFRKPQATQSVTKGFSGGLWRNVLGGLSFWDGGGLGVEDDGGGDVAVFGDEDIEGATQGTVIHYLEAYALFTEQCENFCIREHLALTGTEQHHGRL